MGFFRFLTREILRTKSSPLSLPREPPARFSIRSVSNTKSSLSARFLVCASAVCLGESLRPGIFVPFLSISLELEMRNPAQNSEQVSGKSIVPRTFGGVANKEFPCQLSRDGTIILSRDSFPGREAAQIFNAIPRRESDRGFSKQRPEYSTKFLDVITGHQYGYIRHGS